MDAAFESIYSMVGDGTYTMDQNVYVVSGGEFAVSDIVVMGSHIIVNDGFIESDIEINDGCRLEIYNRGIFNASFSLGNNASVVQVISNESDLSSIDFDVNYSVRIDGVDGLRLSDIMRVGSGAEEILLTDSFVVWDVYDLNLDNLKLSGDIKLKFNDIESIQGRSIISNVAPGAHVQIVSDETQKTIFAINTYVENENLYMHLVRETDYTKIFDNNLGGFINSLRLDGSANGLVDALDDAISMDDVDKIMAESVRIAPINLMDSVTIINMFNMNDFGDGFGVRGTYVMADDLDVYGVAFNTDVSNIGVRIYANGISTENYGDKYSGLMFGGDLRAHYENDIGFVRGMVGGSVTSFDISNVFDGIKAIDNPTGYSMYAVFDVGRRFEFDTGFYFAPYFGGTVNYVAVLNQNESEYLGRTGVEAGYSFEMLGIEYDYSVRTNLDTNTGAFIAGRIGFMSVMDMIGGYAEIGYINNEIGQGYKITAGIDLKF